LANKNSPNSLGATVPRLRLLDYPLGSRQSRAAARAMLVARIASEKDELSFQVVSIVDGSRVNFDGLAERIRAVRMKDHGEGLPASLPSEGGKEHDAGRGPKRVPVGTR
jgi:hypothetical protein